MLGSQHSCMPGSIITGGWMTAKPKQFLYKHGVAVYVRNMIVDVKGVSAYGNKHKICHGRNLTITVPKIEHLELDPSETI